MLTSSRVCIVILVLSCVANFATAAGTTARARGIEKRLAGTKKKEGQGADVVRLIGTGALQDLDPFLMLDHFFVKPPAGFPEHPHRGFQTVTYMLKGAFEHQDNHGGKGVIYPGDVQWMTAGSGILHSELPRTDKTNIGLQLWVNLPAAKKMMKPNYQDLTARGMPKAVSPDGRTKVKIISGSAYGVDSDINKKLEVPVTYLDVTVEPGGRFDHSLPQHWNMLVYVLRGDAIVGDPAEFVDSEVDSSVLLSKQQGAVLDHSTSWIILANALSKEAAAKDLREAEESMRNAGGDGESLDEETIQKRLKKLAKKQAMRFVLIAGEPIKEPVEKYGPFVMNTRAEIQQALDDYRHGRFANVVPSLKTVGGDSGKRARTRQEL